MKNVNIKDFPEWKCPLGMTTEEAMSKDLKEIDKALEHPEGLIDGKRIDLRMCYEPIYGFDLGRTYWTHSLWLAELYNEIDSRNGIK
jgi:hypothetical protein